MNQPGTDETSKSADNLLLDSGGNRLRWGHVDRMCRQFTQSPQQGVKSSAE